MKTILYTMTLAGMVSMFSACSDSDDLQQEAKGEGYLNLEIEVQQKHNLVVTRTKEVDVNTFSVSVGKEGDDSNVVNFATFQDLKEQGTLRLAPANYVVTAAQSGEMAEVAEEPYYRGQKTIVIRKGEFTQGDYAKVECIMQQVKVKVVFQQSFLNALVKTPDDVKVSNGNVGGEHVFKFTDNATVSDVVYIRPTDRLRLSFSAEEKEYNEPIQYDEPLLISSGVYPVANDDLTVTIGLDNSNSLRAGIRKGLKYNIKVSTK